MGTTIIFWISYGTILLLNLTSYIIAEEQSIQRDYCLKETVSLRCIDNEVIFIEKATYGRMSKNSHCVSTEYGRIGCSADVTDTVRERCTGQRNCSFTVMMFLHIIEPCSADFTSYLALSHRCQPVLTVTPQNCNLEQHVTSHLDYVSFSSPSTAGSPTRECPLQLRVAKSQRLGLQVLNKGIPDGQQCSAYAVFREGITRKEVNLCQMQQNGLMYNSTTNSLDLYFISHYTAAFNFLIQLTVIGCSELKPPVGGWIHQNSSLGIVQCNKTREIWYLTCLGNEWLGDYGNCSKGLLHIVDDTKHGSAGMIQFGLAMAVVLGIFIGILAGLILLSAVYVCYKRKSKHEYVHADPPLDYIAECQQKQAAYASMLRDSAQARHHQKCPAYTDVPQAEPDVLACPHAEYIAKDGTRSHCLAHIERQALAHNERLAYSPMLPSRQTPLIHQKSLEFTSLNQSPISPKNTDTVKSSQSYI